MLRGHVPLPVRGLTSVDRLPGSQRLTLAIGLPWRNPDALSLLLAQLYDPTSPNYRQFLTPAQFAERFAPSEADYNAVIEFVSARGLQVTGLHPNRLLLDVTGSVADIENTFHVTLRVYPHPAEARTFFAPDAEPSLDLAVAVSAISGLDNYHLPRPMNLKPRGQGRSAGVPNTGSGPYGNYMGNDFRVAYVPGVALTGSGQAVGLLEFDGYFTNDIAAYEQQAGLPNVTVTNVLIDDFSGDPGSNDDEVSLDIEMVVSMAPGISKILVYEANTNNSGNDILNRMATDNAAKQLSASWTFPTDANTDPIFKEFAAQGQSYFNASGDSDAYTGEIPTPAADTNITIVGGTTLTTSGPGGSWVSERVWNWGAGTGSGGGVSTNYTIPSWQRGLNMVTNQGSTTQRNIPDVALTADNVWVIYNNGEAGSFGGTSCAAPLWAAFTALVNEQALANGKPIVGFVNPAIYTLGKQASYSICFHDIITGNNTNSSSSNKFMAVPGYDLCTGWGTPNGINLIDALGTPDELQITPFFGFSASGPSGGPFSLTSETFILTNLGKTNITWVLTNTASWLSASPREGILEAGGPVETVNISLNGASTNLAEGLYAATVLFTNLHNRTAQTREFSLQVFQSIVENGGFETGTFEDWTYTRAVPSSLVSTNPLYAHSGKFGAALTSAGSLGFISQNLRTVAGQPYYLSLWLDSPDGLLTNEFRVSWNSRTIFDQTNLAAIGWTYLPFVVLAEGTNTSLEFGFRDDHSYLGLDDISVSVVPLPTVQDVTVGPGTVTLTWDSLAGLRYKVEYRPNIQQTNWLALGSNITATGFTASVTDRTRFQAHRFYRVVLLP